MSKLCYEKEANITPCYTALKYEVSSIYDDENLYKVFLDLKANVCDLNPALIVKCITGTEQDFISLMKRAKEYLENAYVLEKEDTEKVLSMFRDCVFGFYVLTPLLVDEVVSDIKVLSDSHVVCKAEGKRYVSNVRFQDASDYKAWFLRLLRIHGIDNTLRNSLSFCTDRKSSPDNFLRIDLEFDSIISNGINNIHIRKIPSHKLTWDYLFSKKMLDEEILEYIKDRIVAGYGFLISGKGGSGKSTLLNNMIDIIPFDESVLVSQESDELYSDVHPQIQFEHTLSVKDRNEEVEFTLEDELRLGLLQDIDDFVIGEIKGGEALYVFTTAMSTGARFFGTIHSNTARSSVKRLAQCARYVSDYSMESLEEMLTTTKFCLIHMSRFSIDEIVEIDGYDYKEMKLIFKDIYRKET